MYEELRNHIIELLNKGARLDGRAALDYRKPVKVKYGVSKNAEGSAQVEIGETIVMTGIKLAIEKPYPDTPEEGCLAVGAELLPMSNPEFESGPPDIHAVEIARVVDRGIRESRMIDMKALCIEKGEKAWGISIDICPINDAGNLFDAAALSALAALKDAKFPTYADGKIDYKHKTEKALPIDFKKMPLSVTVIKIGNHFIVDPTSEEEKAVDARLTSATISDGTLCALQKGGEEPLTADEISKMVDISIEKCKELRKSL